MSKYTVQSLNEIAGYFETLASDQEVSIRWQITAKAKRACETKAAVWRDAANVLRNTEIVTTQENAA